MYTMPIFQATSEKKKVQQTAADFTDHIKENALEFSQLTDYIYDTLMELDTLNDNLEGDEPFSLEVSITLSSVFEATEENAEKSNLQVATLVAKAIGNGDGYVYVHNKTYFQSCSFLFWCSCREELGKQSRKISDESKQRGTEVRICRYSCRGALTIKILKNENIVWVKIFHNNLHQRPDKIAVTDEVKDYICSNIKRTVPDLYQEIKDQKLCGYELLTIKQVYYWWSVTAKVEYCRDNEQHLSAKLYLAEQGQELLFADNTGFSFATTFLHVLPRFSLTSIMVDATYNTNKLKYKLYGIMAIIDGTGFSISYLFLACGRNRDVTSSLTKWFCALKMQVLTDVAIFYTDKDFAQIAAAKNTWPGVNIQLCLWHVKRAVEQRLSSRAQMQKLRYNAIEAHQQCSIINPSWQQIVFLDSNTQSLQHGKAKRSGQLCEKSIRDEVKKLMEKHFNRHMLIPTSEKTFIQDAQIIWNQCVSEMYQYCYDRNLINVWAYLYCEWYSPDKWVLWARSSYSRIGVLRTTMVVESHWRILKRDYLYKFNRPRLDLLCFVIVKKVI